MTLATARLLVGRTIVAVDLHPWDDETTAGRKLQTCYAPVFTLDNGAKVWFTVQETDNGSTYGIYPTYHSERAQRAAVDNASGQRPDRDPQKP